MEYRIVYCAKNQKNFPIRENREVKFWTKTEEAAFIKVVRKHGCNYDLLTEVLPNRKLQALYFHASKLRR